MCVLCVQELARRERKLKDPSIGEVCRKYVENFIHHNKTSIQFNKSKVASCKEAIQAKKLELSGSQGKG